MRIDITVRILLIMMAGMSRVASADGLPTGGSIICPDNSRGHCPSGNCAGAGGPGSTNANSLPFISMGSSNSPMLPPRSSQLEGNKELLKHGIDSLPVPKIGTIGGFDTESSIPNIDRIDCDYSSNGMFGLTFSRQFVGEVDHFYFNRSGIDAPLGPCWTHNYEYSLQINAYYQDAGTIALRTPAGRLIQFANTSTPGVFRADPGYMSGILTKSLESGSELGGDAVYSYYLTVDENAATYYFNHYGRLTALRDRNNNGLDLTYGEGEQVPEPDPYEPLYPHTAPLVKIAATAPDDRFLTLEYTTSTGQLRLERVEASWTPRYVRFEYANTLDPPGTLDSVYTNDNRLVEKYQYGIGNIPTYMVPIEPYPYNYRFLTLFQPDENGNPYPKTCYKFGWMNHHGPWLDTQYDGLGNPIMKTVSGDVAQQVGGFGLFAPSWHTNYPTQLQYFKDGNLDYIQHQTFEYALNHPGHVIANGSRRATEFRRNNDVIAEFKYVSDTYDESSYDSMRLASSEYVGKPKEYYFYNSMGRLTGQRVADDRFTSYTYDINGNVIGINRNNEHHTTYTLDTYGRVVTQTTPLGTTTYVHDNRGHVRQVIDVEGRSAYNIFDSRDRKIATGVGGTTTTYDYDDMDRMTTVTDALSNKTVYTYNWRDQVVKVSDPLLHETTYEYSPTSGTLTSVTDAEGGVISYEYDLYGKVTKLTDQRGKITTYIYDATGRLISETNPLNQTTAYIYHEESGCSSCGAGGGGHLASKTGPDGRITEYEYDSGGRLTNTFFMASNGVSIENTIINTYDNWGRKVSTFDDRLPVTDFPTQTFFYEYDAFDRIIKETYPDGEEVEWAYDINGRRTSLTDPDENVTDYVYRNFPDSKNLGYIDHPISGVTYFWYLQSSGKLSVKQNYTSLSGFSRHEDGYYYDGLGRLANTWSLYDFNEFLIQIYNHNIDSTVNHKHIAHYDNDIVIDYTRWYGYDGAKRLLWDRKAIGGNLEYGYHYYYDMAGNRTDSYLYEGLDMIDGQYNEYNDFNQLTYQESQDYSVHYYDYDFNGNQTTHTIDGIGIQKVRKHDRENRLISNRIFNSAGGSDADYIYDSSGRLLMKIVDGTKTKYYYDGINTLLTREKPNGGMCWRTRTVYALEQSQIGQVMATREYNYSGLSCSQTGYDDTWFKYDRLGNVMATLDAAGTIKSQIDMEAFGKVHSGGQDGVRLTSKEYHMESELYYFGARWYDIAWGGWVQVDPMNFDGPNKYWFNSNNPVNYYDPTGKVGIPGTSTGLPGNNHVNCVNESCSSEYPGGRSFCENYCMCRHAASPVNVPSPSRIVGLICDGISAVIGEFIVPTPDKTCMEKCEGAETIYRHMGTSFCAEWRKSK